MGSDADDVEPAGSVDVDDHGYLGVGGDDEGGEGVSRVEPVPSILILHNVTRQEQAGHTAGHQVLQLSPSCRKYQKFMTVMSYFQAAPVRLLRQLSDGLLSTIFASKSSNEQQQPCGQHQRELADQSGHRRT